MATLNRIVNAARVRIPIYTCGRCGKNYTGNSCWNCG